jgi:hypothetical protein
MTSKAKHVGSILLLVALALTLAACIGQWFTPPQSAVLIVGPPVAKGGRYEVLISVADLPDGGVAGIQFGAAGQPAITFTNVDVATVVAEGLSGFRVTAQQFTGGESYLLAVYGAAPIESGAVLKLSFEATWNPTVTLDEDRVWLANDVPAWIDPWNLAADAAYYTKEAGGR